MNTQLLRYIKSIINDDYAMEVLYFCLRQTVIENDYSLKGVNAISISKKYVPEQVTINVNGRFSNQADTLGLLLSVRALMVKKELLKYCDGDSLLFTSTPPGKYGWIEYVSFVMECLHDSQFKDLYWLLESIHRGDDISDDDIERFEDETIEPEGRNRMNYYQEVAAVYSGIYDCVICNNAFVCDEELECYRIRPHVEYVGNTAFAYCPNLRTIIIKGKNVLFGKFPIVECENLESIVVPEGTEEYYQDVLPYYKDIIIAEETIHEEIILENMFDQPDNHEENVEAEMTLDNLFDQIEEEDDTSEVVSSVKESQDKKIDEKNVQSIPVVSERTFPSIDPKTLKTVFDNKVTSYKYFWLMAILTLMKEKGELVIPFKDILVRMSAEAWPIVHAMNLDLGSSDMLKKDLSEAMKKLGLQPTSPRETVESLMTIKYDKVSKSLAPLLKNVPFRFLSPWIKYISDKDVKEKSHSKGYNGLYALEDDCIIVDEDWYDYIMENYDEIANFAKDSLLDYLKQHNSPIALLKYMSLK